jgi:hypothetical protein
MEALVDSFIGALGLEKSYTMLVLNPRWSPSLPSYNYRIGFSEAEIRLLNEQVCEYVCVCVGGGGAGGKCAGGALWVQLRLLAACRRGH